jgi:bifunctional non-homologous end joining protein LigD
VCCRRHKFGSAPRPPASSNWIHEVNFRLLARHGAERVRLFTRKGNHWTERFPLIVEALHALKANACLTDGEATTCTEAGLTNFDGLRSSWGRRVTGKDN